MAWKDTQSIKRLFNTLKRLKTQVYSQDVDALKQLSESIDANDQQTTQDNILYAKLLSIVLTMNLDHYKDLPMAIKETSKMIKMPLNTHIEIFKMKINLLEEMDLLKSKGIDLDDRFAENPKLTKEQENEIVKKLTSSWTFEKVEKSFYKTATEFLKDVDNYK